MARCERMPIQTHWPCAWLDNVNAGREPWPGAKPVQTPLRRRAEHQVNDPLTHKGLFMNSSLRVFVRQIMVVVAFALVPVALVAFLSIPYNLGGHPGDDRPIDTTTAGHMT